MKATHKQRIDIFKSMGYQEIDILPDLEITVLAMSEAGVIDYVTVIKSQRFNGRYNVDTGKIE